MRRTRLRAAPTRRPNVPGAVAPAPASEWATDASALPLCSPRYVWKLLYIYMLGYEVEFGHMEARRRVTAGGWKGVRAPLRRGQVS